MSGLPKTTERREKLAQTFKTWAARSPFFLAALLFHLVLLIMVATLVIFEAPPKPVETVFGAVKISPAPPPPPAPPPEAGGDSAATEPTVAITPPPTAATMVTTTAASAFNVSSVKAPTLTAPSMSAAPSGGGLPGSGSPGNGAGSGSVFGSDISNGNGFVGYFYDLKQSPTRQPTGMTVDKEIPLLRNFLKGWDEDSLAAKFLKSPKPLNTNQFLIPLEYSSNGPKSFGMADVSQPGYWIAIYHTTFVPSRTGDFSLGGYGDDFLIVRVDGQTVLDSGYFPPVTNFQHKKIIPDKWQTDMPPNRPDYGQTVVGNTFHVNAGESITFDVLIGDANAEFGRGRCGYFIFLLEPGKEYDKDPKGNPILPLLQVQPDPSVTRTGPYPPFTAHAEDALSGN